MADAEPTTDAEGLTRVDRARMLLGAHLRRQPRNFAIAVTGSLVFSLGAVASSAAVRWVTDNVIVARFDDGEVARRKVVIGIALIVAIGVVRAVSVVVRRVFATRTNFFVAASLSSDVIDTLTTQPVSWHGRRPDGDLVGRASVDADAAVAVLSPLPFAVGTSVMLVVAGAWMLASDVMLGLVAFVVFPALLIVNVRFQRRVDTHFDEAQSQLGLLSAGVHESFDGVQLVKSYGAEVRETERLAEIAGRVRDSRTRAVRLRGTFETMLDVVPSLGNVALVLVGAIRVRSGDVSIGELTSFVYLFTLLVFPIRLIGYALSELPYSWAGWRRVREVTDEPVEADPLDAVEQTAAGFGVALTDVSFAYPDSTAVLTDIDLVAPTATVVAVVGPTGSGKSTLIAVAGGLRAATAGSVAAAGAPAVVFQEAFLLSGTVRENVALGAEVDDDEIWEALRLACAERFVGELPGRLETVVGERGVGLSGGQRQRIALARALVRRPAVLLLDDVTSALDPATERTVLRNLRAALAQSTVLMVASRPSTVALADRVVFLDGGRIVDEGNHLELLGRNDRYRQLVDAFDADRRHDAGELVTAESSGESS